MENIAHKNNQQLTPELIRQRFYFSQIPALVEFINTVPSFFLVLNDKREIVYANKEFVKLVNPADLNFIIGKKPGDALECIHSVEHAGGCGNSETCVTCGALDVINHGINGEEADNECRIENMNGNSFDFKVWSAPYNVGNEKFTLFSLTDISDQKRRNVLERAFFHDIMNTIGGLKGFAELLKEFPEEVLEYNEIILLLTQRVIEDINSHKLLLSAENKELKTEPQFVSIKNFLKEIINFYKMHNAALGKQIVYDPSTVEGTLFTDPILLRRVIINMLKNALEASDSGAVVSLGVSEIEDGYSFWVHNDTVIPRLIRLQIFQRSFTTKGTGRGIGTYSMKLFGEHYLKGKVTFESSIEKGTTFYISLPESIKGNSLFMSSYTNNS